MIYRKFVYPGSNGYTSAFHSRVLRHRWRSSSPSQSKYEVLDLEGPFFWPSLGIVTASQDGDCPDLRVGILRDGGDGGRSPYIELERSCVAFEPVGELTRHGD